MSNLPNDYKSAKRFVHRHRQVLPELLQLMLADRESARGPQANEFARLSYQKAFALVIEALEEPPPAKPLLTSQEVMDLLNIEPGPKLGQAIKFLQEAQAIGDAFDQQSAKKLLLAEFGSDL